MADKLPNQYESKESEEQEIKLLATIEQNEEICWSLSKINICRWKIY